jgi:hypothetical protein
MATICKKCHCEKGINRCKLCKKLYQHGWYLKNKLRLNELGKIHRIKHKGEISNWKKLYNRTLHGRYTKSKILAKYRHLDWELSENQYEKLINNQVCYYCAGKLPEAGLGLDRKDNRKGYTLSNVVPCCKVCNALKSSFIKYEEFKEIRKYLKRWRLKRKHGIWYNFL